MPYGSAPSHIQQRGAELLGCPRAFPHASRLSNIKTALLPFHRAPFMLCIE